MPVFEFHSNRHGSRSICVIFYNEMRVVSSENFIKLLNVKLSKISQTTVRRKRCDSFQSRIKGNVISMNLIIYENRMTVPLIYEGNNIACSVIMQK